MNPGNAKWIQMNFVIKFYYSRDMSAHQSAVFIFSADYANENTPDHFILKAIESNSFVLSDSFFLTAVFFFLHEYGDRKKNFYRDWVRHFFFCNWVMQISRSNLNVIDWIYCIRKLGNVIFQLICEFFVCLCSSTIC